MSIEEKIKKLLAESDDEIKDVNDDEDTEVKIEENASKKVALVAKIKKALNSGSMNTQTINGVKNLSISDLELALEILNGEPVGYASKEVKALLGDLVEETEDEDEDDDYEDDEDKKLGTDGDNDEDDEPLKEAITKKDLVPIAGIVRAVPDQKTRQQLANKLASLFAGGNPNFNPEIWHKACGTQENVDESTDEDDEIEIKDIKEDIDVMFSGETLNEDFKTKASVIFESAVYSRVKREVAKISEQLEKEKENELSEQKEQLTDLVDGYLGMVAEQWLNDNEIALENSLKTEMFENFITKMKTVFVESYIDVPDEKFDALADKENEVLRITEQLNKATDSLIQSRKVINTLEREKLINEATSKMSQTDKERFVELTEDYDFDVTQKEDFENRLEIIKESYFGANAKKNGGQKIISDNKVLLKENQSTTVHPDVAAYL